MDALSSVLATFDRVGTATPTPTAHAPPEVPFKEVLARSMKEAPRARGDPTPRAADRTPRREPADRARATEESDADRTNAPVGGPVEPSDAMGKSSGAKRGRRANGSETNRGDPAHFVSTEGRANGEQLRVRRILLSRVGDVRVWRGGRFEMEPSDVAYRQRTGQRGRNRSVVEGDVLSLTGELTGRFVGTRRTGEFISLLRDMQWISVASPERKMFDELRDLRRSEGTVLFAVNRAFEGIDTSVKPQAPVPVNLDTIVEQIVQRMELLVRRDLSEMRMYLEPEHLGRIALRVTVQDGTVETRFYVPNEGIRQLFLTTLPALQEALADHGLEMGRFEVLVNQEFSQYLGSSGSSGGSVSSSKPSDEEWTEENLRMRMLGYNTIEVIV